MITKNKGESSGCLLLVESTDACCNLFDKTLCGKSHCSRFAAESAPDDLAAECDRLFLKLEECRAKKGSAMREMLDCILEDVYKKELSTAYLDEVS